MIDIAKNCLKLEKLYLRKYEEIADFSLFKIANNCINFKMLSLFKFMELFKNNK
jgi:hypothetical protein